ncbi:serine hydrolase domain-containing protein [Sphingomonas sp. FW199]|uniref:serine hydrolase domain-containing protein n=1 Tax=Sphingomonas sp. FW199 TaxID=3400217 RepID=UPI003CECE0A4
MPKRMLRAMLLLGAGMLPAMGMAQTAPAPAPMTAEQRAKLSRAAAEILFWPDAVRSRNFRAMETVFPGTTAKASNVVRLLPKGQPLAMDAARIDAFMAANNVAGLIVVQDGKVREERYGLGMTAQDRWTSFSVAKSFTSTLVGAAVKDGKIASLDDPVVRYVPELKGSGYDRVTVRQVLTMTSGVRWNEDYTNPDSDVARMALATAPEGQDPMVAYLARLPSEAEPGTKWVYKTGETNLIGIIVERATGRRLSDYAQEKITGPAGFEGDLFWMTDLTGQNIGRCCLSVRLRDYARMGLFALEGGKGQVPDGWFAEAGKEQASIGSLPGFGYGYQWWTYPDAFGAQGIFGQSIVIVPDRKLVIAMIANWPKATGQDLRLAQLQFMAEISAAAAN